ncbi:hypothetical protein ACJZ2D_012576 [Fusarium nematophilum]
MPPFISTSYKVFPNNIPRPPYMEAELKTSSQILLSRGVAGTRPTRLIGRQRNRGQQSGGTMTIAALVFDGIGPINVGPASAANVQRLPGDEYGALCHDDRPLSTRLPNEIVQQIYSLLAPEDYDAARYTCRSWFFASLERSLLVKILKRGGWWSSLQQIFNPLSVTRLININQERIMSKWISRECDLSSPKRSAFEQVGLTDFSGLVPGSTADGLHGTLVFTTSLCGRFLMVTHGRSLYVYELNHVCFNRRSSWSVPLRPHEHRPLGLIRPMAMIVCPKRVISCSMDTSAGRYSVALLMEGRMGMVDALTNHDLSRWFPLSSPSDFLYFLPARSGSETGKKLRLISSTAALGNLLGPVGNIFRGFETNASWAGSSPGVTVMDPGGGDAIVHDIHTVADLPSQRPFAQARDGREQQQGRTSLGRISASGVDHHRAIPLSDGHHLLFTDPKTGNLCLGTDAPVGSLNRLIRKVWFRPPANASSPLAVLYTAGADTRHGVRVVATFSVSSGDSMQLNSDEATGNSSDPPSTVDADKQMIVFYTIPPDMFLVISRGRSLHSSIRTAEDMEMDGLSGWVDWRPEGSYRDVGFSDDRFSEGRTYPLEIRGQPVAICSNLVELALDSGPDMVLWAFSAQGWARTWAMHAGREDAFNHTVVQQDGSLRQVDLEGDYAMAEVETAAGVSATDARGSHVFDASGPRYAGTFSPWMNPSVERYRRLISGLQGEGMGGTVSVDLVEEVNGIARMDVELR